MWAWMMADGVCGVCGRMSALVCKSNAKYVLACLCGCAGGVHVRFVVLKCGFGFRTRGSLWREACKSGKETVAQVEIFSEVPGVRVALVIACCACKVCVA